jgi:phosphoribosyl 1,2-cyclic phosphodiesterase
MLTFSLSSGSCGNAICVEAGGKRLIFDAGITGRLAQERMAAHGRSMHDVDAVIISHEHADHIRYAGVFHRSFRIPLYMTRDTRLAANSPLGRLTDVRFFLSGDSLTLGDVVVHTIRTAHDADDPIAFVVEHDKKRLGVLVDLGHPFSGLQPFLESVDAAYLESNYDPVMLETGNYSQELKDRIRGDGGHLSNDEAAELVRACGRRRPQWIAVAHLSGKNNTPELAFTAQRRAVGDHYPVHLAPRHEASELFSV